MSEEAHRSATEAGLPLFPATECAALTCCPSTTPMASEALAPFAAAYRVYATHNDETLLLGAPGARVTVGDFKRAAEVIERMGAFVWRGECPEAAE